MCGKRSRESSDRMAEVCGTTNFGHGLREIVCHNVQCRLTSLCYNVRSCVLLSVA